MSDYLPRSDAEVLEAMQRSCAEKFRFLSNAAKEERERWIVREFLGLLAVIFADEEFRSYEQESKVDVGFRDARFQVKEIPDLDIRRGAEAKVVYKRVMAAKTVDDTVGPSFIYDVPAPINGYELIRDKAQSLASSNLYLESKQRLDLLFYITRTRASRVQPHEVNSDELSSFGWRSISCLAGGRALVLFARDDAPPFLRP